MKKFLVALLAVCLIFSCFGMVSFAEEAPKTEEAKKNTDTLVGMYYLQGECGIGYLPGGTTYDTDYDYTIADKLAAMIKGTDRIPFYADETEDGGVFLDRFSRQAFITEMDYAATAGVDFIAYKYYAGYAREGGNQRTLELMNCQLKMHATIYPQPEGFKKDIKFALFLDEDFNVTKDSTLILNQFILLKGYLTDSQGLPVVFVKWTDAATLKECIEKMNRKFAKAVKDGADPSKTTVNETIYPADVQKIFFVAVDAPDPAAALAAGADAVTWSEGSGSNGEAYTAMTSRIEANWAKASENVIPNVVTGFDKSVLDGNKIEIKMRKYSTLDEDTREDLDPPSIRYSRSGSKTDAVAKATPDEFTAHLKKAVDNAGKPKTFNSIMVYAWEDLAGGAYLVPTKTDTKYEYEYSLLKAMRKAFYGTEDGFPAMEQPYGLGATPTPVPTADTGKSDNNESKNNNMMLYIIIGGAAVVVIAVVVIIAVTASKKKNKATDAADKKEDKKE